MAQAAVRRKRFRSGENLPVGWKLTMVQAGPDATLGVAEPDMQSIPAMFVDAVDHTLVHLRSQRASM